MTKYLFGILKVLHGADDLTVERHVEIVKSLLSWILPLVFPCPKMNVPPGFLYDPYFLILDAIIILGCFSGPL